MQERPAEFEAMDTLPALKVVVMHELEIAESADLLTVRAQVGGINARQIRVRVEPHRLTILGMRQTAEQGGPNGSSYKERWSHQVLRVLDLPGLVDPLRASARLRGGTLEIILPKVAESHTVEVQQEAA